MQGHGVAIFGGGSGLGAATATRFASHGAEVVIADVNADVGKPFAESIGAQFVQSDVTEHDPTAAALDLAHQAPHGLRVAVNCAGVLGNGRLLSRDGAGPLEHFRRVVDINLVGTINVVRLAAERMATNDLLDGNDDKGVCVLTSSMAAFEGQVGQVAYSASKAGVAGMTLAAARDLARFQIRVMSIAPGSFATPMFLAAVPEDAREVLLQSAVHPRRAGDPDEYARLVEHIVDNPMLNGETIRLDGGVRMPPR
jgi:NAD(P)-dependent dehydrogenase (short-subunit alcohol dehydrogenase family)